MPADSYSACVRLSETYGQVSKTPMRMMVIELRIKLGSHPSKLGCLCYHLTFPAKACDSLEFLSFLVFHA